MNIFMKLVYQYMLIFFIFLTTLKHLHPLQVENCDSNSRLVVDEDDNGNFRLERVKKFFQFEIIINVLALSASNMHIIYKAYSLFSILLTYIIHVRLASLKSPTLSLLLTYIFFQGAFAGGVTVAAIKRDEKNSIVSYNSE